MKKHLLATFIALIIALLYMVCGNMKAAVQPEYSVVDEMMGITTFEKGVIADNTYTSETAGIKFTIDESWRFIDEEDDYFKIGMIRKTADDKAVEKALEDGASMLDMHAIKADNGMCNVNIIVKDTGVRYGEIPSSIFNDKNMKKVEQQLEHVGVTNVNASPASFAFAGSEHMGFSFTGTHNDQNLCGATIYIMRGQYLYTINCFSSSEEELANLMNMFSAL